MFVLPVDLAYRFDHIHLLLITCYLLNLHRVVDHKVTRFGSVAGYSKPRHCPLVTGVV